MNLASWVALLGLVCLVTLVSGPGERVPPAAVVNGLPQGMFVGRSLLTGRAVCLLFLSGGRITRFIPAGGLENFDWGQHQAAHSRDSGKWELSAGELRILWGDGGIQQGPLTVHPNGIEFYGKRYARLVSASIAAMVGRWEAARGSAVTGGAGINTMHTLVIEPDGRYRLRGITGGIVAGRSASGGELDRSGKLTITGATLVLTADDGTTSSHTFVPVAGDPLNAFSLDTDLFTRAD